MSGPLIFHIAGAVLLIAGIVGLIRPVRHIALSNRWRAGASTVAGLLIAGAALAAMPGISCGCQLPPVPNAIALQLGAKLLHEGHFAEAKMVFDDLLKDQQSIAYWGEAYYGRALSEQKLGEGGAAQKDFAAAVAADPNAGRLLMALRS
jgi:tetratricopeptide (TPR) repeat protein